MLITRAAAAQTVDVQQFAEPADLVKTYRYESTAEGATPWVMNGTVLDSPAEPAIETVDGLEFRVRDQITTGIDGYAPVDTRVFFRDATDGLFTGAYDANGTFNHYLALPANISPGDTWQGPSKFWETETLLKIDSFTSPLGKLDGCAHVERSRLQQGEPPQDMVSLNVYCPGLGAVLTRTEHTFEGFRSVTEQLLISAE